MTDQQFPEDRENRSGDDPSVNPDAPQTQEIRHSQVSARVPEHVARGVFSTGAVVLQGSHEFILDFLLRVTRPQQVAARIILPPSVVARFLKALEDNLRLYEQKFGPPQMPPMPQQQGNRQTSAQELYDQLKLPEDIMSGTYANAVMIGHSATEFCFDFITTFFPRSAVAARVYLSAPNVPRLLDSLRQSFDQFRRKQDEARQQRRGEDGDSGPPPQ